MKTKELMIGDWVCYKTNATKEARKIIYPNELNYFRVMEPVPLTPEILEKNWFELKPDGWLWCKEKGIEDTNYIFIQFRKGCDEVRLVELNFVNNVLSRFKRIKYVHELQHALRLCGIKKEIIL